MGVLGIFSRNTHFLRDLHQTKIVSRRLPIPNVYEDKILRRLWSQNNQKRGGFEKGYYVAYSEMDWIDFRDCWKLFQAACQELIFKNSAQHINVHTSKYNRTYTVKWLVGAMSVKLGSLRYSNVRLVLSGEPSNSSNSIGRWPVWFTGGVVMNTMFSSLL